MLSRRRVLLGGATIGLAGCGSSDNFTGSPSPLQATSPVTQGTNSQLFVLNANSGTRNGDQLRLVNVNPDVVWFDDRPSRQAGRQTTLSFVQGWASRGFDSDPPNAVLQVDNSSFPIILSQPILDGPAQTLSFTIQSDAGAPPLDQLPTTWGLRPFHRRCRLRVPTWHPEIHWRYWSKEWRFSPSAHQATNPD